MDARVAVLASGSGTNLQALLDDPVLRPHIALAVSDREGASALERAREAGVRAIFVDPGPRPNRDAFGKALLRVLRAEGIEYVVLAGFMRILSWEIVRAFDGRMVNVHPSLLPSFPGAYAVRDALAWGARVSGVTVHLVDEEVDHGPIVVQEPVPVLPDDDEDSLHARLQAVEHRLYPQAVRWLIEGRLKVEGRQVHVIGGDSR